ncbi:hypothetical protein [Paenibacillus sp. GYB003]|uniref:hypothetical protein n=1 Tax=Paenibacillus sp. GYB003 TaxID=2994392 RepID=UPI002F96CDCD
MERIDKAKLLEWLKQRSQKSYATTFINSTYKGVIEEIERGTFDPDPAPVPTLQKGDKVRHKDNKYIGTGVVLEIAKSGLRAHVDFSEIDDWDKVRLNWAPYPSYYRLDKLIKVEG